MSQNPNPIQRLRPLGQSVWYDNVSRSLIETGELNRFLELGVTGLTSNPTIFEKAISSSDDYDSSLLAYAREGMNPAQLAEALAIADIQAAADILRPVYDSTGGADGFASLEVNPHLARDTAGTVAEARRLFAALDKPNAMIKVPATPEGVPAVRALISEGINVNVTLIFSLDMYAKVREAYLDGLEALIESGGDPSRTSSVASFFVSRVDTAVDALLEQDGGAAAPGAHGQGGGGERHNRLSRFQGGVRDGQIRAHGGEGRARPKASVGVHQHQKPGLQRRPLRRDAHRREHGEHDAGRHADGVSGPRRSAPDH